MGWGQGVHSESEDDWPVSSSIIVSKNTSGIGIPLGEGTKSCPVSHGPSLGAGLTTAAHTPFVSTQSRGLPHNRLRGRLRSVVKLCAGKKRK